MTAELGFRNIHQYTNESMKGTSIATLSFVDFNSVMVSDFDSLFMHFAAIAFDGECICSSGNLFRISSSWLMLSDLITQQILNCFACVLHLYCIWLSYLCAL